MKNLQANKASKCGRTNCKTIEVAGGGQNQKNAKKKAQMEYKKKGKQTHSKKTTQSAEQMEQLTEAKMANNQQ